MGLSFLDSVPEGVLRDELRAEIGHERSRELGACDRQQLYDVWFALKGHSLLSVRGLRRALLGTLPAATLMGLCDECGRPAEGKPYDLALRLSTIPWRAGTRLVRRLGELFDIPPRFLPEGQAVVAASERIEAFRPPPGLWDYQSELVDRMSSAFCEKGGGGLLQLPTGAGKTRTAVEAIVRWRNEQVWGGQPASVLWLAHTEELCHQAAEAFERVWRAEGQGDLWLARFWGSLEPKWDELEGPIVVGGYQKVTNAWKQGGEARDFMRERIGLVVVDEAHRALAPSLVGILEDWRAQEGGFLLGLTATPGRTVGDPAENRKLARLFGGRRFVSATLGDDPVRDLQARRVLSSIRRETLVGSTIESGGEWEKERPGSFLDADVPPKLLQRLALDEARNRVIVNRVHEAARVGEKTLVFACTVGHARGLALDLALRGVRAASVDYGMAARERQRITEGLRHGDLEVVTNFGVLSTGFDAPGISVVVIARPTGSAVLYSQMIGRGLRGLEMGGTRECTIVDVLDNVTAFGGPDYMYHIFDDFWAEG